MAVAPVELVVVVRDADGKVLDQWPLRVPPAALYGTLARLREAVFAVREDVRGEPSVEQDPDRARLAAMAERSRMGFATRKHLDRLAREPVPDGALARHRAREAARRAAEEERRRVSGR